MRGHRCNGERAILPLTEKLLNAAGIRYDPTDYTWAVAERLLPVVTVECGEDKARILEALVEVRAVLEAIGYKCNHFVIGDSHVSVVGLTSRSGSGAGRQ